MTQTLLTVAAFVLLLAMVPMAIKWLQSRVLPPGPRTVLSAGCCRRWPWGRINVW